MHRRVWPLALAAVACSAPAPLPLDAGSAIEPLPAALAASSSSAATTAPASSASAPAGCGAPESLGVTLFTSPRAPHAGAPLRVLAVASSPLEAALSVRDGAGADVAGSLARARRGGGPFWWYAEVPSPAAGAYRVALDGAGAAACAEVMVEASAPPAPAVRAWGGPWTVRAAWSRATEALYAAWIEKLFDAPPGEPLVFSALHEALRDPARNLLYDHLGLGEDDGGPKALPIDPDCADLPYFLRAYFAFKLGLPFGFSSCTRGGGGQPPHCLRWHSNLEPVPQRARAADTFVEFLRVKLADTVHSGTGRTPAGQDEGDYYPVPISFESLRPGTIYADPYGHVLVLVARVPQTEAAGGVLLAVDGQPDGTVSRRRFWRGNFLFALDPALGSPGFKRFRPVVVDAAHAGGHGLTNSEIAASTDYGDVSLAQYAAGVEGFYDAVDDALSPRPLDPARALDEAIDALDEQVKGRVRSVANAARHFAGGGGRIDMPEGASIFETTGPWEDFSTPSRDLRLLVAIDVVRAFPERVARRPERFAMPSGKPLAEVKGDLEARLRDALAARRFSYERSDGSSFSLTLADVMARAVDLEMAYDPNDCPEVRWGAPAGSEEAATCRRRAPWGQVARMRKYRGWFHERRRPPRG